MNHLINRAVIAFVIAIASATLNYAAESNPVPDIILTPYLDNETTTPNADRILRDKLHRIVTAYGVGSQSGINSPFIITAHAIELDREQTATVPPQTAVRLSLTLYIGNGEDGTVFSTCNTELKGVGADTDKAYASAFRRLKVNDSAITDAIAAGKKQIADYYSRRGPSLIKDAEAKAAAGDFATCYKILLEIPPVCPQYNQAQQLLIDYLKQESDFNNSAIIAAARIAWNSSPDAEGASEASVILASMKNPSPALKNEADQLMNQIGKRLQNVEDQKREIVRRREENRHTEKMAVISGVTQVVNTFFGNLPNYKFKWW